MDSINSVKGRVVRVFLSCFDVRTSIGFASFVNGFVKLMCFNTEV